MAEDPPVLDFFPSKFKGSGKYEKIKLGGARIEPTAYHPFQIVQTGSGVVKVYYGAVNSIVPDEVDPVLEDCTEFSVGDGDKLYLNIDLDMDHFQNVDTVEVVKNNDYDQNLDDKFSILIGEVSVSGNDITIGQIVSKNVSTVSCGIVHDSIVN